MIEANNTRNVIRTPALNKLRMEDKHGEEHIKLSTEYGGKTQLNSGHNVNAERALRGEGAELRTDDWGVIRGGNTIAARIGTTAVSVSEGLTLNPFTVLIMGLFYTPSLGNSNFKVSDAKLEEVRAKLHELNRQTGLY